MCASWRRLTPGCAVPCSVWTLCPGTATSCTRSCVSPWLARPCSGVPVRRDSARQDCASHVCTPKRGNPQRLTTTYTTMNATSHPPAGMSHLRERGQPLSSRSALSAEASAKCGHYTPHAPHQSCIVFRPAARQPPMPPTILTTCRGPRCWRQLAMAEGSDTDLQQQSDTGWSLGTSSLRAGNSAPVMHRASAIWPARHS